MFIIVLMLGVLNFFWGEKVPAGGGFGWDGVNYAHMVRNIDSMISNGQLSGYYSHRILPSVIVRTLLSLAGVSVTDTSIIQGFELYNLALLLGACFIWKRLSNKFSLSLSGRWIGFSGIFINFQCSKLSFYYPVLTDVTALFCAMLLLLFYVEKKPIPLFLTTIIGAFAFPEVSVIGVFLLVFLRTDIPDLMEQSTSLMLKDGSSPNIKRFRNISISLILISIFFLVTSTQFHSVPESTCNSLNIDIKNIVTAIKPNMVTVIDRILIRDGVCGIKNRIVTEFQAVLTGIPSIIVLLIVLYMLFGSANFFRVIIVGLRKTSPLLVILAIAAFVIPVAISRYISNSALTNANTIVGLITYIIKPLYIRGGVFLPFVSLAVFWGPLVLLLILYWNAFCVEARKLGVGYILILCIYLTLALIGEPRFLTGGWPFLVFGMVMVLEKSEVRPYFKLLFIFLTILYAQFWVRLNYAPWLGGDFDELESFPKQLYFMHLGLWMAWWPYLIQMFLLVISAFGLHKSITKI